MSEYKEDFATGSMVQVKSSDELAKFMRPTWQHHHPVSHEQLQYAGAKVRVLGVAFYHGGDPLYTLSEVPGLWHEQCLQSVADQLTN
jgi:hypothetical protein